MSTRAKRTTKPNPVFIDRIKHVSFIHRHDGDDDDDDTGNAVELRNNTHSVHPLLHPLQPNEPVQIVSMEAPVSLYPFSV